MQVQIAIGENHRFELREALLVYYGNQTTFITKHEVTTQQNAAPTLGPAQPLTMAFVESLVRSLGGGTAAEVFPENILAKSDHMLPGGHRHSAVRCSIRTPRERRRI
jgi:hypothetical protein